MPPQFEQWLPSSAGELTRIIRDNCTSDLGTYRSNANTAQSLQLCRNVLNCVLSNSSPSSLAIYQAANVLLGLTPPVLAYFGNSVPDISLLASERPLLALMLAVGAPTTAPTRLLEYKDPLASLKNQEYRKAYPPLSRAGHVAVSVGQYLLAAAAGINVYMMTSDLSRKAIYVPNCQHTFLPFLWLYIVAVVHLLGILAFPKRVTIKRDSVSPRRNRIRRWLYNEVTPCALHYGVSYESKSVSFLVVLSTWLGSIGAVTQFVFGTILLSSTTLIDTTDAVSIVIRYAASTILCRIILVFELYGLQAAVLQSGSEKMTKTAIDGHLQDNRE